MRKITFTLGLVTALILGACNFFAPSSDIQTENLQNDVARTQIAAIRASATVDAERLAITAEYASGSIANAALQSTRIVSTLMAQGTRFIDLPPLPENAIVAALPTALAPPANGTSIIGGIPTSTVPAIGNPLITPGMGGAAARGGATIVPVPGVSATPVLAASPNANAPALSNIQVSARVGADDCAISPSPSFNTGVTELYLVATATNIAPGMTISSRWTRDGVEVAFYEWTPDFAVNGACIWFLAPGAEVDLSTGSWNVQLAIDGAAVGSSGFTING